MPDKPLFEVKVFPAHFADASEGTIVSIVHNHRSANPIHTAKLSALTTLTKTLFSGTIEENNGTIVAVEIRPVCEKSCTQYTLLAGHIPEGQKHTELIDHAHFIVDNLNIACS